MKTGIENLMEGKDCDLPENHKEALVKHYNDNNVQEDLDGRLKFWEDEKFCFSHDPTPELRLALHEQCWLSEKFPEEFCFC